MHRWIASGLCAGLTGALAACAYDPDTVDDTYTVLHEIEAVRGMEPQGPDFNRGLREGYLEYADLVYDEVDLGDYYHFAFKAVDSAKGELVLPDAVESRELDAGEVDELAAGRARLMAALEQTGRKKAPWRAADAQTAFDCWLERAEDNDPPEEIEACKGRFEQAIAEVERSLVTDLEDVYLTFFAWDQADLSPVAMSVLEQVLADYERAQPAQMVITGHADRSGSEAYNLDLSEQRARSVAQALVGLGTPADALRLEWYGETQPRVETADDIREPQNRRVEIEFE